MRLIDTDTIPAPIPAPPCARFPISRHALGCFGGEQTPGHHPEHVCEFIRPTALRAGGRRKLWEAAKRNSGDSAHRGQVTSLQSKPGWVRLLKAALIRRINCVMKRLEVLCPGLGRGC